MKNLKNLAVTIAMLFCCIGANAFVVDGISYSDINPSKYTVRVSQCSPTGDIVIPSSVSYGGKKYSVIEIGSNAFQDCKDLTSVVISDGISSIGGSAFYNCTGLTSITIPESVTSIGQNAFYNCSSLAEITIPKGLTWIESWVFVGCSSLASITIPDGVTSIGKSAFSGCSSLTSITIPDGVTSIGQSTFSGCSSLTSITIPDGVTSIGQSAFSGCSSLTSIAIPEGVTSIGYATFDRCENLATITIPKTVTSIGQYAFRDCRNLASISIPESVMTIGENAFVNCMKLTEVHIESVESWIAINSCSYPIVKREVKLYVDDELLTELEIPSTISSIPSYAFYGCSSLTSIILPDGVTSIGNQAFYGCSSLADIHIGSIESWLKINYSDSYSHPNYSGKDVKLYLDGELLTEVEIPATVTSIPSCAFKNCSSLTSISIPESVTTIGAYAFSGCGIKNIVIPNSVTSIVSYAFENFDSLTSIVIPSSVTSIGNYAFNGCTSLKKMIFEDGDSPLSLGYKYYSSSSYTVGRSLFYDCPLETLYIGRDLSYGAGSGYGFSPFYGKSLTSVIIGENVTSIGDYAFHSCNSIDSITIPENIASIGKYAFSGCDMKEMNIKATTPPTLTSSNFIDKKYAVLSVPKGVYDDYKTAPYWSDWVANITVDDVDSRVKDLAISAADDKSSLHAAIGDDNLNFVTDLTVKGTINSYDFMIMRNKMPLLRHLNLKDASIVSNDYEHYTGYHTEDNKFPAYGLYNCKLFSIIFPENITDIGRNAVQQNLYLSEIVLYPGLKSIGGSSFSSCDGLTSVILPEGLVSIGVSAFNSCDSLTYVTFPKGVTSIGDGAFSFSNLKSVILPEGLTSIGKEAFKSNDINNLILPPTLKEIGKEAFANCDIKEVRIPSSVRTLADNVFIGCSSLDDIYVYTVEPFSIGQNTFVKSGNNFKGTLHAPKVSYWDYYYDTQWSQFASFAEFDEPYENFYLVGDKELDNTTGTIEGEGDKNPDAEMGNNSGLIVEDDIVQDLGNVEIEHNGTNGGSIIVGGEGCVNADKLSVRINVTGGKWYFFCFPFDVKREDIILENGADWVFRYYDGEERANNGKGGWKNVTSDGDGNHLKVATGYIFQCSKKDVLILTAKNQKIKQEKKYNELVEHVTQNAHDASWNFVGNPYLSYYEVTSDDYSAPITVWDGSKYIAIRPGDDDYQLAPFEAFFVQKPEGVANVDYSPERQHTYHGAQKAAAQARARRRTMPVNPDRLLVNITLGNGTDSDQTRVVFNNKAAMGYETACDAAKFETAGMPQIYTVDSRAVKYAINERPVAEGIVTLGYTAPAEGVYTLAAPRMDTPISIKDNLTGTIHDFAEGSYEFASEAGTFDDRFTVIMKAGETGIENSEFNNQNSELYNVKGQRVNEATEQGIYIKENRKVVKL